MPVGKITTYDLTEGLYLDFEPMIHLLSPSDVPLQGGMGADGRSTLSTGTVFETSYQWHDESLLTPRSTANEALDNSETGIDVLTGEAMKFGVGDVIKIDDEVMYVTATDGDVLLTVTRAFAGTSAATHLNGAAIVGIGTALPEGSDPENARSRDRTNRSNFTQIFGPWAVQTSGTEQVIKKYGLEGTTEFDHQAANRLKEMFVAFEQALVNGVKYESSGTKRRLMGGIESFITTNVDSSTTTMTEDKLLDQMQIAYDAGGSPDRLLVGSKQKRVISTFDDSGEIQIARTDDTSGRVIDYFDTDFGRLSILLNRWLKVNQAIGFARDQAEAVTLRPFGMEMLAKTGDSIKGQLLGEKGLKFRRELHAFKFTALT